MASYANRRFLSVKTGNEIDPKNRRDALIRVMQWNILADALSHSSPGQNFIKCSQEVLNWSSRRERILCEILVYSPDMVCLQEVDHFHDYFLPELKERGYVGHFLPKPDSPCLRVTGHSSPDGCAIFLKRDRLEFGQVEEIGLEDSEGSLTNQVAIAAVVKDLHTMRTFVAGVTHLKAKEGNEKIREAQGKCLVSKLKRLASGSEVLPIVLCGDFNATPVEPVYKEMRNNGLESSHFSAVNSEPLFTTWKHRPSGEVRRTIDYVWHSPSFFTRNYLEIPKPDVIGSLALPSFAFPSDHVSLVFDFDMC